MFSDAIDIDFGEGQITRSCFNDVGGDAIDVSGAKVTAREVEIKGAGDKAISVGELSEFTGENFKISDVAIAIASKDGSKAFLTNSEISNVHKMAYASYIKKPEYTKATLKINKTQVSNCKRLSLAVSPCDIVIDGHKQRHKPFDINKLYQTNKQKKEK